MAFNQDEIDKLVKLMSQDPTDSTVKQMVAMMSSSNLNTYVTYVNGEQLIIFYLRKCTVPNLNILTAFATYGCDFNVQAHDGRTPLHLLISKKTNSNLVEAIKLVMAHGGDPSVVDIHGNNVLMVAVLINQDSAVLELLTREKTMAKLLVTQKNAAGYDVVALYLLSPYNVHHSEHGLERLVHLGTDVLNSDNNGDSCLHHLFRGPDKDYLPNHYRTSGYSLDLVRCLSNRKGAFETYLNSLISAGANVNIRNILSIARASEFCKPNVIEHLIRIGAKPYAEDLKIPLAARNKVEIVLYIDHMLPNDICHLRLTIPNIVSQIISLDNINLYSPVGGTVEKLVSNGFGFTIKDLKMALDKKCLRIARHLLMHMDSSVADHVTLEMPDILVQVLRLYLTGIGFDLTQNEMESVVALIVNQVKASVNYVNYFNDSAIQCILDLVRTVKTETECVKLFDIVASRGEFDTEQTVQFEYIKLRPLDLAMQFGKYILAAELIMAGAACRGIHFDNAKRVPTALKLLKLLYHLGIYVDIAEDDLIYEWARSQPFKRLQELSAMAVRRNFSRKVLKKAIAGIELPDDVNHYLELKHLMLNNYLRSGQRGLECLIPFNDILSVQASWPNSITGLVLTNYSDALLPFLKKLVSAGLNCSHEQLLPTALRFKFYQVELFKALVDSGPKATLNDILVVLTKMKYLHEDAPYGNDFNKQVLGLLLERSLPDDLVITLSDEIPGLFAYLINCYNDCRRVPAVVVNLLERGLVLKYEIFRTGFPHLCQLVLRFATPEVIVELNAQCKSVFEQFIARNRFDGRFNWSFFGYFVEAGVRVTVESVTHLFGHKHTMSPLVNLIQLMADQVKGELKVKLPNAISKLVDIGANLDATARKINCYDHQDQSIRPIKTRFDLMRLIDLFVKLCFNVTIGDLIQFFDTHIQFSTLVQLVNAANGVVKGQLRNSLPDAIATFIANKSQYGFHRIESCVEFIGKLINVGVKTKVDDLKTALLACDSDVPHFPIPCLIKHLDISLKDEMQREMPDLLVNVFGLFLINDKLSDKSWLIDTMKFPIYNNELRLIVEKVLNRSDLDLDMAQMICLMPVVVEVPPIGYEARSIDCGLKLFGMVHENWSLARLEHDSDTLVEARQEIKVRPINYAIQLKQYKLVNKLIFAGANCDGLDLTNLKEEHLESLNTGRLLYISGHYQDIDGNFLLKEWIETLPVRSLLELAALTVRRNRSRSELVAIVENVIPTICTGLL